MRNFKEKKVLHLKRGNMKGSETCIQLKRCLKCASTFLLHPGSQQGGEDQLDAKIGNYTLMRVYHIFKINNSWSTLMHRYQLHMSFLGLSKIFITFSHPAFLLDAVGWMQGWRRATSLHPGLSFFPPTANFIAGGNFFTSVYLNISTKSLAARWAFVHRVSHHSIT